MKPVSYTHLNTFVVYHNGFGKKPVMGVTYTRKDTGETVYSVYTREMFYRIVDATRIVEERPHSLGDIPIIELSLIHIYNGLQIFPKFTSP